MYEVRAMKYEKVYIEGDAIIQVLEKEISDLLGGRGMYIKDGKICEDIKYHSWITETYGEATPEQIETYEALKKVTKHFRDKGK